MIPIDVYVGADVACGSATPVISQTVTVPEEPSISLVATAGPDQAPSLLPVALDVSTPEECWLIEVDPELEGRTLPRVTSPSATPASARSTLRLPARWP